MTRDRNTGAQGSGREDDLISMKNLSLLALPWLGLQKSMLRGAKRVNAELPYQPILKALVGSQVGLIMIMKQRRMGKALIDVLAPDPADASKHLQRIGKKAEALARRSNEFLDSYEVILDATIEELKRKRAEGEKKP